MNKSDAKLAKARRKVESTNSARCAEMRYARLASSWVTLIGVDGNAAERAFPEALRRRHFFCELDGRIAARDKEITPDVL